MTYKRISFDIDDNIAKVGFGHNCDKSMTVLDEETLTELKGVLGDLKAQKRDLKGVIFFTHKKRCFLAGADINLIASMNTESEGADGAEQGQSLFNELEDLGLPTVACVHGVCLGGGTEFALACKSIIMSSDSSSAMGLPEVKLGLIPGFGGTYRLPKKVGLPNSLDMILTGKMIKGRKAKKMGLVDEVYPKENLVACAQRHFKNIQKKGNLKDTLEHFAADNFVSRKIIFQKARENVLKKTKGFYEAPLKILDVMEAGMMKGRASYLASEAQAFGELCTSEQSKNLQHIFFMTETAKKYAGPKGEGELPSLERGACVGAGTMGGGIAWLMANAHMFPIMKDLSTDALDIGLRQSSQNFMGAVKRRKMSRDEFSRKQRSITAQLDYHGFKRVDLLIEAIVEDMKIKKAVFAEVEKEVRPDCLLTSNTSSLSVTEMATALENPARFAGLHFFNPVHRMPLVEIITHDKVAPETVEALYKWALKVKKTPVIVKDGPGFLVNRILMPYLNEAGFLLEEGVSIEDIDKACLNFGLPMGPCRLLDEVGLDVGQKVAKILHDGLGDRAMPSGLVAGMVEKGMLGRKTQAGFYLYDESGKAVSENEDAKALLPSHSKKMSEVDIQMRVILPMINEASICLSEEIVATPGELDLALIFGIGFPPFRGGLLRYADSQGLDRLVEALNKRAESIDPYRYGASPYLLNLVKEKKKFYE